jgi:cysteine desulfurase/selenocysteine lyase
MLAYMLEHSLNLKEGDGITMTVMEHHSALLPFAQLAKRSGCALSSIPMNDAYALDLRQLATYITPKTKIVVVAFSSNVLGTVNDVRAIAERAHQVGAPLLVDAAGAAGHIPIDVTKLDCDFLTFSGHKMCAPTGVGVLYGKKAFLEKLEPSMYGGGMVQAISDGVPMFADVPARFEAGTPNISGVIGLGEAVRYVTAFGVENVHAHVRELTEYAITQLDSLEGVTLYTQRETKQNTGVISFTVAGIHPHDVAEILGRKNVAVRAGHHCAIPLMQALGQSATMRASVYLYNATDDIDRMVEAIRNAQKIFA